MRRQYIKLARVLRPFNSNVNNVMFDRTILINLHVEYTEIKLIPLQKQRFFKRAIGPN